MAHLKHHIPLAVRALQERQRQKLSRHFPALHQIQHSAQAKHWLIIFGDVLFCFARMLLQWGGAVHLRLMRRALVANQMSRFAHLHD